jgi:hypothetical protein
MPIGMPTAAGAAGTPGHRGGHGTLLPGPRLLPGSGLTFSWWASRRTPLPRMSAGTRLRLSRNGFSSCRASVKSRTPFFPTSLRRWAGGCGCRRVWQEPSASESACYNIVDSPRTGTQSLTDAIPIQSHQSLRTKSRQNADEGAGLNGFALAGCLELLWSNVWH